MTRVFLFSSYIGNILMTLTFSWAFSMLLLFWKKIFSVISPIYQSISCWRPRQWTSHLLTEKSFWVLYSYIQFSSKIFENCGPIFGWISSGHDNGIRLPGSIRHISKTRLDHHQNIFWWNCLYLELKCCQKILTDLGGRIEFVENSETFQWDFEWG